MQTMWLLCSNPGQTLLSADAEYLVPASLQITRFVEAIITAAAWWQSSPASARLQEPQPGSWEPAALEECWAWVTLLIR
jgi:hypothetical protein